MSDNYKKVLEENGADVEGTIRRFMGNEAVYQKFLGKFLSNPNYGELEQHLKERDYQSAYVSAHTLKGVAANLGLNTLYEATSNLVEELRDKEDSEVNEARAAEMWTEIQRTHTTFCGIIQSELFPESGGIDR